MGDDFLEGEFGDDVFGLFLEFLEFELEIGDAFFVFSNLAGEAIYERLVLGGLGLFELRF